MSHQLRGSHEDSETLAHLLLFLTSRSLWDLQCCPNLSPTHFWGTWGNSESHILTPSYCAPWCPLITEPWGRHVVTLREPLWEEPCFIVQCAASWDLKNAHGVQRSCSLLGAPYGLFKRECEPSRQRGLFRFCIPISLGKASVLKTRLPQQLRC